MSCCPCRCPSPGVCPLATVKRLKPVSREQAPQTVFLGERTSWVDTLVAAASLHSPSKCPAAPAAAPAPSSPPLATIVGKVRSAGAWCCWWHGTRASVANSESSCTAVAPPVQPIMYSSGAPCTAYPNALRMPCACKHAPVALLLLPVCDQAPCMSASLCLFIAAATLHNCL